MLTLQVSCLVQHPRPRSDPSLTRPDAPQFFARVFTTPGDEVPTADNLDPLEDTRGYRCSFVWFSQASIFQYTEGLDGKYVPGNDLPKSDYTRVSKDVFPTLT